MTREEAVKTLKRLKFAKEYRADYIDVIEAFNMALKSLEKIEHLKDRPCSACEFHSDNGCSKWNCVFEK